MTRLDQQTNTQTGNMIVRMMRLSILLRLIVILLGCLVLMGWSFNITFLKHPFPGTVAMNPVTALFFIFAAISFDA